MNFRYHVMVLSDQLCAPAVLPVIHVHIPSSTWVVPRTSLDTMVTNRISTMIGNRTPVIEPTFAVTLLSEKMLLIICYQLGSIFHVTELYLLPVRKFIMHRCWSSEEGIFLCIRYAGNHNEMQLLVKFSYSIRPETARMNARCGAGNCA
jgi:hypothetical protein